MAITKERLARLLDCADKMYVIIDSISKYIDEMERAARDKTPDPEGFPYTYRTALADVKSYVIGTVDLHDVSYTIADERARVRHRWDKNNLDRDRKRRQRASGFGPAPRQFSGNPRPAPAPGRSTAEVAAELEADEPYLDNPNPFGPRPDPNTPDFIPARKMGILTEATSRQLDKEVDEYLVSQSQQAPAGAKVLDD